MQPGEDVAATKAAFDEELRRVKEYLGWLSSDCRSFNESLPPQAKSLIVARQQRLDSLTQGTNTLGIPIRSTPASHAPRLTSTPPQPTPHAPTVEKTLRYDVALSFAGENRPYVEEVAVALKKADVVVFYDTFEKADLWGKNLIDHLAEIYQNRSRFVVMFISEHYVAKAWPKHERQSAQARALVAKEEYILPTRFDDTEVPGLTTTVGHIDLRTTPASELVQLILAKIGRKSV